MPVTTLERANTQRNGFSQRKKLLFLRTLEDLAGDMAGASEAIGVSLDTIENHVHADTEFGAKVRVMRRGLAYKLLPVRYRVASQDSASGHPDAKMLLRAYLPEQFGDRPTLMLQVNGDVVTFSDGESAKRPQLPPVT